MIKNYFVIVGALLVTLSVIGFSDNLLTDIGQPSNRDPKFVVHGLFWFAWLGVFVAQAALVRRGDLRLHRRLGVLGFGAAVGVVLSTLFVFVAVWRGWSVMPVHVKATRMFLACYALCVYLAWRNRRRPDWHKRLNYVGTLFVLLPILDRAAGHLPVPWGAFMLVTWNGFFVSLFAYDFAVAKRIHPVTWAGFGWFYVVWLLAIVL